MTCCIKKHPTEPVGACGASPSDVEQALKSVETDVEVAPMTADEEGDDFANNASLPAWKQECIRNYTVCKNQGWTGNCHDCLRYCEGQKRWPINQCHRR